MKPDGKMAQDRASNFRLSRKPFARTSGFWTLLVFAGMFLFLPGCDDIVGAISHPRTTLTFEQLSDRDDLPDGPVDNSFFMPVGEEAEALHDLTGTLRVAVRDDTDFPGGFPAFSVEFFTHRGRLVPMKRDIIKGRNGDWDIILSPGRVWSEPDDEGWSRASFPFTLTSRDWNESHNGLATFLFNDEEVSDLVVQVVQEAAAGAEFDGWTEVPFSYTPGKVRGLEALKAAYDEEVASQVPVKLWSDLDPKLARSIEASFDGKAINVTVSGLVINGVFYGQPCRTRFGDYPYCSEMRHGVYSVTKTMGAALSLFWLAQKYGDGVYELNIEDYVEVTATHDGWDDVTFEDALNMMTGVGSPPLGKTPVRASQTTVFESDDEGPVLDRFAAAGDRKAKLKVAFSEGNYPWGPGEVGRYNTAQTFILAAAMDAFLKSREGPNANLWDRVSEEVLKPLGVYYAPMMHTREADGSRGVPIMGWGYVPTLSELIKVATLFNNGGKHNGRQLIDGDKIEEVFSNTEDVGYQIDWDNDYGQYRYGKSFWFMPYEAKEECFHWVPEMIGFGGNLVQLLPNGMIGIRLADGPTEAEGNPDGVSIANIADRLESFCD